MSSRRRNAVVILQYGRIWDKHGTFLNLESLDEPMRLQPLEFSEFLPYSSILPYGEI